MSAQCVYLVVVFLSKRFIVFRSAHHYWAVLSRSSGGRPAGWLTIWATPPPSVVPPGPTPDSDSAVARVGLGQRTALLHALSAVRWLGILLSVRPISLPRRRPTPRRSCLLLARARREPMDRCVPSRFEIVCCCQFREATGWSRTYDECCLQSCLHQFGKRVTLNSCRLQERVPYNNSLWRFALKLEVQ